jgi:hypothetical protein
MKATDATPVISDRANIEREIEFIAASPSHRAREAACSK